MLADDSKVKGVIGHKQLLQAIDSVQTQKTPLVQSIWKWTLGKLN